MSPSGLRPGDPERIGEFTLIGRLGAGGMGVVYLARDAAGQPVAVKRLREELCSGADFRARFRREAAALLRVQGACTARVLAVEVEASSPFVVMEYIQGPTLAEQVGEHGPLRGDVAYGFAVGLAEALVAIHRAGVVHRDLKPSNVLLSDRGPKVIDFGIAHAVDETALTSTGVTVGTVGYLAPERVSGPAGPPADVYAWALTVAYATTGRPPFGPGPVEAVLYRVLHGEPDLVGVPARLWPALTAALARSPEQRPTAERLLAELTGARHPGTIPYAGSVNPGRPTAWQLPEPVGSPPRPKRRATLAAVAVALVFALVTAGIVWLVLSGPGHATASGTTAPPSTTPTSPSPTTTTTTATTTETTTTSATSTTTQVAPPMPFTGAIINTYSGLCVDTNGPQQPGLNVVLRTCGNYSGQIWHYDQTSLHLTNTPSGLCLDTNGNPATGVTVVVNQCGDYTGQQWNYNAGYAQFSNPTSGLCLDTAGNPAVNQDLVVNPCGNFTGQIWRLAP